MLIIFCVLLTLRLGGSAGDRDFGTKTVALGQNVTLNCTRPSSWRSVRFFWIRIVSGNLPEVLGGAFNFDYDVVNTTPRITAKREPGAFILHINTTELSDTGVYYCIKINRLNMTFLKGTFLRIKGPEPDLTAVIKVQPGDSVTLQCSVLSDSENKFCPGEHSVSWFKGGSNYSHPSLIYTHGNSGDECEKSPEAVAPQSCVYNLSLTISSSDAGTYYCAVATCGEILFGNGTKLDIEVSAVNMWDLQSHIVLHLSYAALAFSLIVIVSLIYIIKNKSCSCCNTSVVQAANAATTTSQQRQQRDEDSLVYSAPAFTKRNGSRKAERRNVNAADGETFYSGVRSFTMD